MSRTALLFLLFRVLSSSIFFFFFIPNYAIYVRLVICITSNLRFFFFLRHFTFRFQVRHVRQTWISTILFRFTFEYHVPFLSFFFFFLRSLLSLSLSPMLPYLSRSSRTKTASQLCLKNNVSLHTDTHIYIHTRDCSIRLDCSSSVSVPCSQREINRGNMDAKFSRVALAMHKRKEEKGESRKRKKKEFFQSLPRYNSSSSCISLFLAAFSPFSPEESLRFLFLFPSLRTSHKPLLRIYMYIHIDTHIHTHTYIKFYLHRSALLDEKLEEKKREENHFDRLP